MALKPVTVWKPTADDYRLAARVLRAKAREMESLPWWQRWQFPHRKLREFAANLEEHADCVLPNFRKLHETFRRP